jgi:hypothetical protein
MSTAIGLHAQLRAVGGLPSRREPMPVSRRERILVKPDWPLLPWSGLLIAVKAFARVRDIPTHQRQRTSV